jgi:MFS family permease
VTVVPRPVAAETRVPRRAQLWGPFGFRDFRLLWAGMVFANFGTWIQFTALGYYVAKLAPNVAVGSFYIGLIGASRMLPVLICSPIAGVVADCFPRRRTLLLTNGVLTILAIALAAATWLDVGGLPMLMAISALTAAAQSFDNPARQSWVSLLVPREMIGNAIGLNSLAFNGPAVIGPPIAGIVIAAVGVPACMVANVVTAAWVMLMIFFMQPAPATAARRSSYVRSFTDGIRFIYRHDVLRWVILMIVVTSLSVRSYNFLLPAFAVHELGQDATGLGWLMGAAGFGAMCGALSVAWLQPRRRSRMWVVALMLATAGVAALGLSHGMWAAALILFIVSGGTQAFAGSSNVLTQTLAPEEMRGRAMSVYTMVMLGLVPGGALICGSIAMLVDLRIVFVGAGALACAIGLWVYLAHPRLRAA